MGKQNLSQNFGEPNIWNGELALKLNIHIPQNSLHRFIDTWSLMCQDLARYVPVVSDFHLNNWAIIFFLMKCRAPALGKKSVKN
jgi:hypothetical protein